MTGPGSTHLGIGLGLAFLSGFAACAGDMPGAMMMEDMTGPAACAGGTVRCGGACIDPMTSAAYCGASQDCAGSRAGTPCNESQICSAGVCLENDAALGGLALSHARLVPDFTPGELMYAARVFPWVEALSVTATAPRAAAIQINGAQTASGAASAPIALAAGITMLTIEVRAPGGAVRRYGVAVARSDGPSTYIKASNSGLGDHFGASVSLSGDTLAVGAPQEDSSAVGVGGNEADNSAGDSGAVYIYRRTGTTWAREAYIKASNTGAGDHFGASVSLSGDTLAVGAPQEDSSAAGVGGNEADNSAGDSGAVYIYRRTGTTWAREAYIKASNTGAGDHFGASVSLSGDTLAVGAPQEDSSAAGVGGNEADNSATNSGAVYVYRRTGTTWAREAYIKASNTGAGDHFGASVSLSGDTLAAGAPQEDSGAKGVNANQDDESAIDSGAVYVFVRAGDRWAQQAYMKASNTGADDHFGASVSLSGDTLAIGAYLEDSRATGVGGDESNNLSEDSGAVYVFVRAGDRWAQQAYMKASNTGAYDWFGRSVSLFGDTLLVGAPQEASSATGVGGDQSSNASPASGAAYLFRRMGGAWTQEAYLKASNTYPNDYFGFGLSIAGDTLAVGARFENSKAVGIDGDQSDRSLSSSGAVYLFR